MIQPLSSANRIMIVGLSSEDLSLMDLSVLARWTIAPHLMGVPGVAHVAIWGQRDRQLQVLVDPAQLQDKGVSLDQVIRTAGNALWVSPLTFLKASSPGTGGFIDTPNQRLSVWHVLPISSADELGEVAVEGTVLSYMEIVRPRYHEGLTAAFVPGILRDFDLPDLAAVLSPRPLWIVDPRTPTGALVPTDRARTEFTPAVLAYERRGHPAAFRILHRPEAWPLDRVYASWR
jgi:hypothetical protein